MVTQSAKSQLFKVVFLDHKSKMVGNKVRCYQISQIIPAYITKIFAAAKSVICCDMYAQFHFVAFENLKKLCNLVQHSVILKICLDFVNAFSKEKSSPCPLTLLKFKRKPLAVSTRTVLWECHSDKDSRGCIPGSWFL